MKQHTIAGKNRDTFLTNDTVYRTTVEIIRIANIL